MCIARSRVQITTKTMLEEAKPSAGGLQPQEPALLAEAEAKFQEGIAAIKVGYS